MIASSLGLASSLVLSVPSRKWSMVGLRPVDHEVIPHATLIIRHIDPNAITSENAEPHFRSAKTRFLELVAVEVVTMLRDAIVSAINQQQAIVVFVSFQEPVFKYDLLAKK